MYTDKHDFHVLTPKPVSPIKKSAMEAAQDNQMNFRNRIRAAMVWISEKLPFSHPQFQIIYSPDEDNPREA